MRNSHVLCWFLFFIFYISAVRLLEQSDRQQYTGFEDANVYGSVTAFMSEDHSRDENETAWSFDCLHLVHAAAAPLAPPASPCHTAHTTHRECQC